MSINGIEIENLGFLFILTLFIIGILGAQHFRLYKRISSLVNEVNLLKNSSRDIEKKLISKYIDEIKSILIKLNQTLELELQYDYFDDLGDVLELEKVLEIVKFIQSEYSHVSRLKLSKEHYRSKLNKQCESLFTQNIATKFNYFDFSRDFAKIMETIES